MKRRGARELMNGGLNGIRRGKALRGTKVLKLVTAFCAANGMFPGLVLASDTGSVPSSSAGYGVVWVWLICFLSRKRPIGGWLLFYFISIYLGLVASIAIHVLLGTDFDYREWTDKSYYILYLLTTIPQYALVAAQGVVAAFLISSKHRQWKYVLILRRLLLTCAVFALGCIVVDIILWPSWVLWDVYAALLSFVWFLYFGRSTRVKLVFRDKIWSWEIFRSGGWFTK